MLSVDLAQALRDAGLVWRPAPGDRFVLPHRGMDDEVFVVSDMTIEVHRFPTGPVIGFNGTTEWALDSVRQEDALWLPAEHQLRELLGDRFARLEYDPAGGFAVTVLAATGVDPHRVDPHSIDPHSIDPHDVLTRRAADAAQAYGLALLDVLSTSPQKIA